MATAIALAATLAGCGAARDELSRAPAREARPRVLVVTEARRYVHVSIPAAVAALRGLARRTRAFRVEVVGTAQDLTPARLVGARVVAFVSTTGELHATPARQAALLRWIRRGGAFLGLHSVSATYRGHVEFHRMLGATFRRHPSADTRRLVVEDRTHPATRGLPRTLRVRDEFYEFTRDPRRGSHVLVRLATGPRGPDRPLVWWRRYRRGRVFVDSLGHFPARWRARDTLTVLGGGLRWLLG